MIEKIELWFNIVHYCIYKADYKLHLLSNKLNPFLSLGRIPAVKKKFEEQGTSLKEIGNKVWTDRRYGFGVMISGGAITIFLFFVLWSIFLVANSFAGYPLDFSWHPFVICLVISYFICHLLVFQKNKYISYFKGFDKRSKHVKRNYGLLSFVFVISTIVLFIYSFRFLPPLS
jgi:hypothetical protein